MNRSERNKLAMRISRRLARGLPEDAPLNTGRKGEYYHSAKLTKESVKKARRMREAGHTVSGLADGFGVSKSTMSYILSGKTWRD
jgi:DNA invertase Pin-like site-specific DNA recombinase